MVRKKDYDIDPKTPAWVGYHGETYTSSFSGTAKQRREREKALAELLGMRNKRKKNGRRRSGKR